MGKLTMGVFPGLVGSLSLDFSVKLAEAAVKKRSYSRLLGLLECDNALQEGAEIIQGLFNSLQNPRRTLQNRQFQGMRM